MVRQLYSYGVRRTTTQQQQQRFMPHTLGAYDESLYRTGNQQIPPVPPSTPSGGSRQQAQAGVGAGFLGGCGCAGQGCGLSGAVPGPVGQIPSMNVAGGGFMSQWQNPGPTSNVHMCGNGPYPMTSSMMSGLVFSPRFSGFGPRSVILNGGMAQVSRLQQIAELAAGTPHF